MKAKLRNADVLVGAMAFGLCLWSCGCATHELPRTSVSAKVDSLFSKWNRPDSPGAAVVVVKDGTVIFQRGYGCANLSYGIPITPQTVFDAASVAKQFTGLVVAILIEQGKLSLDDDVRKHLTEVPNFGTPITIRHLLYHTSGLRDWFEMLMLSGIAPSDAITTDTILAMVRRQRNLDFAPGEEHGYSNTGYNLLAAIVAKVTKQSFREWTDANLFRPLGMTRTHFCDNAAEIVSNPAAYYTSKAKGELHEFVSQLAAPGSSSLLTTAEDMGRWLINFGTAHVGGTGAIQLMQQPGKVNAGKNVDYGFGLGLDRYHGMKCVYHTGSWAGDCAMLWLPEKRFGVAVFANAPETNPGRATFDIANIYFGYSQPTEPQQALVDGHPASSTSPKPTSEQLAVYVGDYWSEELQTVYHVELRNGELMMGQRLNGWRRLVPKGPDGFQTESSSNFPVAPTVKFARDSSSAVVGMNLTGGRVRSLRFVRISMH